MKRKNLYLIGARGFGRELVGHFRTWNGFCDQYVIRGYLDDNPKALDGYEGYPPIVSSVESFSPSSEDVFVCALGVVKWREKYIDMMAARGGRFETVISPTATLHATAKIGMGCLILNNAIVSSDVTVGDYVLCHANVFIGHDTSVGAHSVIETYAFTGGFVKLGERVTLHTRATVVPRKRVGADVTVGVGSTVIGNVRSGKTVFGIPAVAID